LKLNPPTADPSAPEEVRFESGLAVDFVDAFTTCGFLAAPLTSVFVSFFATGCVGLFAGVDGFDDTPSLAATLFESTGFADEFRTARAEVLVFATALAPDAGSALAWRSLRPAVHPTELKAIAPAKT
jgi:hypothetical protein